MSIEKEILDSIAILIKKSAESNTQIYIGTVTNLNGNKCSMLLNGKVLESVRVYGTTPPVGAILPVFVPSGNFNVAFTMYMQGGGGSSTGGAVTSVAGKTGDVTLTKADVGLSNVANVLQYSEQNKPPYPVTSVNGQTGEVELTIPSAYTLPVASSTTLGGVKPVAKTDKMTQDVGVDTSGKLYVVPSDAAVKSVNGKTGAVSLTASDVGALPDTTDIPTATSDLTNDSGYITAANAPVRSVNSKIGVVTLTASDVNAVPTAGGDMTGNLNVKDGDGNTKCKFETNGWITGTWLRTTEDTHLASTSKKVAVISDGWIYDRTPAELKSDMGIIDYVLPVANSMTLGGVRPTDKTAAMTQKVGVDANGVLYVESSSNYVVTMMRDYSLTSVGFKADRTRNEIIAAMADGKQVILAFDDGKKTLNFFPLVYAPNNDLTLFEVPFYLEYNETTEVIVVKDTAGATKVMYDYSLASEDETGPWLISALGAEIPVATSTRLGGVKPIAKTSDMTQTVGVDSSGRLYTTPGGGSGSGSVVSVNGQTGTVVLKPSDIGALPDTTDVPTKTSQLTNDSGFISSAPVQSVNGQKGVVSLTYSDVGALPSTTTIPSKTSQLTNDSGFLTSAPVTSVNSKAGVVTLNQDDVGNGSTYVRTHNDFTDALKAQISTNATNISGKQAKITTSGILKGNGNGGVSAAVAGTDYAAVNLLVVSATQPTSQPNGGVWYKLGKTLS